MKIIQFRHSLSNKLFFRLVVIVPTALVALLLIPLPTTTMLFDSVGKIFHILMFGVFALLSQESLRRKSKLPVLPRYCLAFLLAALIGIVSEYLQKYTGRDPAVRDALWDCGGAAGLLVLNALTDAEFPWPRKSFRYTIKTAVFCASLSLFAVMVYPTFIIITAYQARDRQMPRLCDFDNPSQKIFLKISNATLTSASGNTMESPPRAILTFHTNGYSGLILKEPCPDWRKYHSLILEIDLPDLNTAALTLRIDDYVHNGSYEDRFNKQILLRKGTNTITIPLQDIQMAPEKRQMRMDKIWALLLFTKTTKPFTIILHRLALE